MSGTQEDEGPQDTPESDDLPDALIEAMGLETARRAYLKELALPGEDASPELDGLPTPDELAAQLHDIEPEP